MTTEENKAIIRRLVEIWNTGESGELEQLIDPSYMVHYHGQANRPGAAPAWYREVVARMRTYFPDYYLHLDDLLADGDKVIWRATMGGTHKGELRTAWGASVPPTGNRIAYTGIFISRMASGKVVEDWWEEDWQTIWQQLGAIPSLGS